MTAPLSPAVDYLSGLNEQQRQVVSSADGPCLVLAGAGSGKTRVLVHRLCYLLDRGVPASSIVLLAFTNRAAREMVSRVERMMGSCPRHLWAGTFHHIGNIILRRYGRHLDIPQNFTILDEEDSVRLLKDVVDGFGSPEEFPHARKIREILSFSVNTVTPLRDVIASSMPRYASCAHLLEAVATEYQKRKKRLNALDYDDLLLQWHRLMTREDIGRRISEGFRYVMVDEYHDTNRLQSLILYQLARVHRNILVVGDDAQSIFSFRGATINNILEFTRVHQDAKTFTLTMNYRSTPEILALANDIISRNRIQFPKKLVTLRTTGVKPVLVRCSDARSEALYVAQRLFQLISAEVPPSDIGVLFRSRYQAAELEIELTKLRIPYVVRGGLRFFEQAHIKDVIAFLRVAENLREEISWRRIFSLCDGIGKKSLERLMEVLAKSATLEEFAAAVQELKLPARGEETVRTVFAILASIRDNPDPAEAVDRVLNNFYRKYLEKHFRDDRERIEDVEGLKEIASGHDSIQGFLAEASLQESFRGERHAAGLPVVLSTIHQAKGLEWRIVFVIGLCANHFPHQSATADIRALEEERRIFYVAVTRAKEDLNLTYYMRDAFRTLPSRKSIFIEEISEGLVDEWFYS